MRHGCLFDRGFIFERLNKLLYVLGYFMYAFTQSSIMMRFDMGPRDIHGNRVLDFLGYFALAPAFSLIGIMYIPFAGLTKYVEFLNRR